jgi:protoporphyrinogen oxidase
MAAPNRPPSFVILGGGPAGLAAAYKLAARGSKNVTLLERSQFVGGNAGSRMIDGIPVDFGSHRLHPSCPPDVMADIRALLGDDLLDRPRHGRIRLRGRWVHFPLKPFDLLTRLPPSFMAGVLGDGARKAFSRDSQSDETFASILERGLGRTICRDFYFPYASKIWGLAPSALDPEQARRRVSNGSLAKMLRKVASALPGVPKPVGAGRFFYPRRGFGQISEVFREAAEKAGARIVLGASVEAVTVRNGAVQKVTATIDGVEHELAATSLLSTIPITNLAGLIRTDATPAPRATERLGQRSMVLIYLSLDAHQFTEFDAHYFPESELRITRLSEPKNYSLTEAPGRTVLCAELPCARDDREWTMSNDELARLVISDLERAGLGPIPRVSAVHIERLPHAYPLYTRGYREHFDVLDQWVGTIEGLVTFGRQGLFAHDNTHHTMAMAYALVDALDPDGQLDAKRWAAARRHFESHVVED